MEEFRCGVPHIVFRNGKLKSLGDFVKEWANNAFLVIDPYLDKIELSDEVITLLKESSIETSKYTDIKPNPGCFGVDKATHLALTGYYFDISGHPKQVTPEDTKRVYRQCI